jgi:hypothetical protein
MTIAVAHEPTTLSALLSWYIEAWALEPPDKLHLHRISTDDATGAPTWTDAFRHYMTDHPQATDEDGYYRRPMHAALRSMNRKRPLTARWLFRLGMSGGDIMTTPATPPGDMGRVYAEMALAILRRMYMDCP